MTPERWHKIEEIFQTVIELPPAERPAVLTQFCAGDVELRREIEALLDEDETDDFLQAPIKEMARSLPLRVEDELLGQHIGPYHIRQLLGQGGMGAVYLAERADAAYYRQVALKLVRRGPSLVDSRFVLKRFRVERQILATLEHPNIAQLLDGGSTPDGLPYFVMDYIAGQPLTEYCNQRQLSHQERLRLFLPICAAVQHAHQKLIVHRDLKPGNILVTADGVPKLLDFGIAKLLDPTLTPEPLTRTLTSLRLMTPDYASPEQVRGLPVTTASDIYSLGAVLYELLTGARPHRFETYTPAEIERAVCDTAIIPPSVMLEKVKGEKAPTKPTKPTKAESLKLFSVFSARPASLKGDLDNIVMMALRKEPERRYQTVEQLAEDIRRYLAGRPISARRESAVYRTGKFVRRNKLGVAAGALIMLSLLAGIVTTARAARVAQRERDRAEANLAEAQTQRNEAEKQRAEAERLRQVAEAERAEALSQRARATEQAAEADLQRQRAEAERAEALAQRAAAQTQHDRAERRFAQVRKLANTFLFEFHDKIATLPGSTAAREMVVKTALEYLDSLSKEADDDPTLSLELATAYAKVADVQGAPGRANLGQRKAALENYSKAIALGEQLLKREPDNEAARRTLATSYTTAGFLHMQGSALEVAKQMALRSVAAAAPLPLTKDADAENFRVKSRPHLLLSRLAAFAEDSLGSLRQAQEGVAFLENWLALQPSERAQRSVAAGYDTLSEAQVRLGDLAAAAAVKRRAIALVETLLKAHPTDALLRQDLQTHYISLADVYAMPGTISLEEPREAIPYFHKAIALCEELVAADPNNIQALRELSINSQKLAEVMRELDPAESLRLFRKVQELSSKTAKPGSERSVSLDIQLGLARTEWRAGEQASARQHLQQVQQWLQTKINLSLGTSPHTYYFQVSGLLHEMGEVQAAQEYLRQALALMQKAVAQEAHELLYQADLADCYARFGNYAVAQASQAGLPKLKQIEVWREARAWFQKSLAIWREWPTRAPSSPFNRKRQEAVAKAIAQCDAALVKLGVSAGS